MFGHRECPACGGKFATLDGAKTHLAQSKCPESRTPQFLLKVASFVPPEKVERLSRSSNSLFACVLAFWGLAPAESVALTEYNQGEEITRGGTGSNGDFLGFPMAKTLEESFREVREKPRPPKEVKKHLKRDKPPSQRGESVEKEDDAMGGSKPRTRPAPTGSQAQASSGSLPVPGDGAPAPQSQPQKGRGKFTRS